jgi:hypothetical protein
MGAGTAEAANLGVTDSGAPADFPVPTDRLLQIRRHWAKKFDPTDGEDFADERDYNLGFPFRNASLRPPFPLRED